MALEDYATTPINFLTKEIVNYQVATLLFCFFIALSVYLLLPKKIEASRRISAAILIFIGLFGLFSILLKTLITIIG